MNIDCRSAYKAIYTTKINDDIIFNEKIIKVDNFFDACEILQEMMPENSDIISLEYVVLTIVKAKNNKCSLIARDF